LLCDGIRVSGYFDDNKGYEELAVSTANKDWLAVLVHEFCHVKQHMKNTPLWKKCNRNMKAGRYSNNAITVFFNWLDGKRIRKEDAIKAGTITRDMELECERMGVKEISKWELPINKNDFINSANSYILFYNYCMKHRTWYNTKGPYQYKKIRECVSSEWMDNYDVLPENFERYVSKYCI